MADLENGYSLGFCLSRWWNHMAGAGTGATNTHIGIVRRLSIKRYRGGACLNDPLGGLWNNTSGTGKTITKSFR